MPSTPLHLLRIKAVELLRQPGSRQPVATQIDGALLGLDDERITGEINIDLTATSNIDGIVVEGVVSTPFHTRCRRCLVDVGGVARAEFRELYQDAVAGAGTDEVEAEPIEGDQIDLAPVIREYVLLELPAAPLCRDDCAGICPVCGTDLNVGGCNCDTSVRDERWAALDELRLDDG